MTKCFKRKSNIFGFSMLLSIGFVSVVLNSDFAPNEFQYETQTESIEDLDVSKSFVYQISQKDQ